MAMLIRRGGAVTPRRLMPRSSEAGAAHPALPAVVLLVAFAVFMAAIAPLDFSSILHRLFPGPTVVVPHQSAAVWVDNKAGVYYCANSIMFGKTKGAAMKQVEALDRGYQPALGTYCTGPAWHYQARPVPAANSNSPAQTPNPLAPTSENPLETPKPQLQSPKGLRSSPSNLH